MKEQLMEFGVDPRSPTTAFYRTPIVLNTSKNNLLLNTSEDSEEVFDSPITTNINVLGIDPRSPTNEFMRTPIVLKASNENLIKVIHNKNLEKVIQSEICTTPTIKKERVTPKLLESSPVKPRSDCYKRKSFVGLLETNVDFTETDIDAVLREKCRIKENNTEPIFDKDAKENTEVPSENEFIADIPEETNLPLPKIAIESDTKENDQNKPTDTFEKTPEKFDTYDYNKVLDLLVSESKEAAIEKEKVTEDKTEITPNDVIEVPVGAKSAPLSPKTNIILPKCVSESKSAPVTPPLINITADVKELDKKLTNLIYEDQDIVVCPRIVQLKDVLDRSPLKNRNKSENEIRKSAQKLKVSDKPRKSDYAVSKIPVFKCAGKGKVQCENTPPRNMERINKGDRKSQWDNKDVTLYL